MPKLTEIVISCDHGTYGKCGVLQLGGIRRLACRAISASAELLVTITTYYVRGVYVMEGGRESVARFVRCVQVSRSCCCAAVAVSRQP